MRQLHLILPGVFAPLRSRRLAAPILKQNYPERVHLERWRNWCNPVSWRVTAAVTLTVLSILTVLVLL